MGGFGHRRNRWESRAVVDNFPDLLDVFLERHGGEGAIADVSELDGFFAVIARSLEVILLSQLAAGRLGQ